MSVLGICLVGLLTSCGADAPNPHAPAEIRTDAETLLRDSTSPEETREQLVRVDPRTETVASPVTRYANPLAANRDSINAWRRALDRIASSSKRGEQSVAMRRAILRAMSANSDTEFRAAMASLPVAVSDAQGEERGLSGTSRSYSLNGKVYVTRFIPSESGDEFSAGDARATDFDAEASTSGPSVPETTLDASIRLETAEECEPFLFEDQWYYGECATQQEIDDAIALTIALDAEITADYEEAQSSCLTLYGSPACFYDQDNSLASSVISPIIDNFARTAAFDSPDSAAGSCGSARDDVSGSHPEPSSENVTQTFDCIGEAIAATGAVGRWIIAKGAAYRLMQGATSSGVGAVVFGVTIGGLAAGYTVGSLLNCLAQ